LLLAVGCLLLAVLYDFYKQTFACSFLIYGRLTELRYDSLYYRSENGEENSIAAQPPKHGCIEAGVSCLVDVLCGLR
jgi:hypothetical protein